MPINETLSTYSDWLYTTAAAIYVVALMFTLIEQGFGARGRLATERAKLRGREVDGRCGPGARPPPERAKLRPRDLVGAGGPPVEDVPAAQREVGRPERIGRM